MAYLADTSAWIKSRQRSAPGWLRERFNTLLLEGGIVICDMVKIELLHHEQDAGELERRRQDLDALPWCAIGPDQWRRALDVQRLLCARGGAAHRGVATADYLIAAAAETADLTLLHYDRDYDVLAEATGQPAEWVAQRGSL
jgi:predicted nucleic acid-binding protein